MKSCIGSLLVVLLFATCDSKQTEPVSIVWANEKATGLIIHRLHAADADLPKLEVRLVSESERTPVLGAFVLSADEIVFTPIVPLTRGLTYELLEGGRVFGEITIPISNAQPPEVVAVYPLADTVPENLLKVYLSFSQPMAEGKSADFVHLLKDGRDTMKGTFLDLQPELWNPEGNVLTLWLDPGRIKVDLIPNKELGNPLERGAHYEIRVATGWKSRAGIAMVKHASKEIYVAERDDQSPQVSKWDLETPKPATTDPLLVDFHEPLDRMLLESTFEVLRIDGTKVETAIEPFGNDRRLRITPLKEWQVGSYDLVVESRLEDLAGNNLNRLFEVDLNKESGDRVVKSTHAWTFKVEKPQSVKP